MGTIARYRLMVVLLTAALLATLTVALTGGDRAEAIDGPVDVVYVATGRNFPDALAGSTLAGALGAPLLTVEPNPPLPQATIDALTALDPDRIVVFGGPGAVSDGVVGALTAYARSGSVTRIAGDNRHDTAQAIADALPTKVHDSDLLDGLDSADFLRSTAADDFVHVDDDIDATTLGGDPAAAFRTWPLQFVREINAGAGADLQGIGGPLLGGFGTSGNYPALVAYYAVPPVDTDATDELTMVLFTFNGDCSVRLRVQGWNYSETGTSEFTFNFPDTGTNRIPITLTASHFDQPTEFVLVERRGDHPDDDCDGQSITIPGMYITFE